MGRMTAFSLHRRYLLPLAAGLLSLFVVSCESTKKPKSGYDDVVDYTTPKTGLSQEEYPFDKDGNYLADVVSGKKKGKPAGSSYSSQPVEEPIPYASTSGSSYTDTYEKPVITAVDTPSSRRNPIYEKVPEPDSPAPASSSSGSSSKPKGAASSSSSSSKAKPKTTTASSSSAASKAAASKAKPKPAVASTKSSAPKSKSKPETASKSKTAARTSSKPAYTSYKVKNGDTLYSLANRYGTSVGAIKQANGMSSNVLANGRTLRIPKK